MANKKKQTMSETEKQLVSWIMERIDEWTLVRDERFMKLWEKYERIWRGVPAGQDKNRKKERSKLMPPALTEAVDSSVATLEDAYFSKRKWFDLADDVRGKMEVKIEKAQKDLEDQKDLQRQQALLQQAANDPDIPPEDKQQMLAQMQEAIRAPYQKQQLQIDKMIQEKDHIEFTREQLLEDFYKDNVPRNSCESILLGAMYGTLIGKVITEETEIKKAALKVLTEEGQPVVKSGVEVADSVSVYIEPVSPDEFVIDTSVTKPGTEGINQALGCAHVVNVARHKIVAKQDDESYKNYVLGSAPNRSKTDSGRDLGKATMGTPSVYDDAHKRKNEINITEYHGLVPKVLLKKHASRKALDALLSYDSEDPDAHDLVEAVVTIANGEVLLKAIENPHMMKDRDFVAAQFETVPRQFWGRGIIEKGYWPYKALEAEMRARIDAMAFSISPMLAVNVTQQIKGQKQGVYPGKQIATPGDPRTSIMPIKFADVSASTFHQTGELERMIQNATGQLGGATPTDINARNNTTGGMSMIQSGTVKRAKRTLRNIESSFLGPFIQKAAWRYMQYDHVRYPSQDYKFVVYGAMANMAREVEQQQLTYLLSIVPSDGRDISPEFAILLLGIIENSSLSNKDDMKKAIEQRMQPSEAEQAMGQLAQKKAELELEKAQAEVAVLRAEEVRELALAEYHRNRLSVEETKSMRKAKADEEKLNVQLAKDMTKKSIDEAKQLHKEQNDGAKLRQQDEHRMVDVIEKAKGNLQ